MSSRTSNCPSCGGELTFTSSITVSVVCPYCRSLVVRRDLDVEALGKVAQLPPDLTPLQLGSTGTLDGVGFRLIGRVRWQWDGGSWTEWYAESVSGAEHVWLAETQGFYTLTVGKQQAVVPSVAKAAPGTALRVDGKDLKVVDIKMTTCAGAEGELPEIVPMGTVRRSVDLQGTGLTFATIEVNDRGAEFYSGRYATFAECGFKNLRDVPGWTPGVSAPNAQAASFACPHCGAPLTIRASGLTMSVACGSCGSVVDADDTNHTLLAKARQGAAAVAVKLPIGGRGTLNGTEYEVIGCVDRSDGTSSWQEYLVFNPWRGFVWLVTYNGHWAFIERLLQEPKRSGATVRVGADDYRLFSSYGSVIQAVVGEFYWKTAIGERTEVADYVSPPHVASREEYPGLDEVTWSQGTYIDHRVIAKAFNVELAKPDGIWLNQPNPYSERKRGLMSLALLTAAIVIGVQMLSAMRRPARELVTLTHTMMTTSDTSRSFASDPFTVTGPSSRVEVEGDAHISNQWASFDLGLIDEKTGERYDRELELEYYNGYDSDGAWSEGSSTGSVAFSAIPAGTYHLLIEPTADPTMSELSFSLAVREGGLFWSAFLTALVLVLAYPALVVIGASVFETKRWADSDSGKDG